MFILTSIDYWMRGCVTVCESECCEAEILPLITADFIYFLQASVSRWLHIYSPYLEHREGQHAMHLGLLTMFT